MSIIKKLFSKTVPVQPTPASAIETPMDNISEIDIDAFHHNLAKEFHKQYSINQMLGFRMIISYYFQSGYKDIRWLAYMLATTWHETGFTMQPVTEYGSEKYLQEKPYWPYIGRGYVQITHKENYAKYGIENNVEMALDPEYATYILIHGMINGIFTGRKLSHYFNETNNDPFNARKIINGLDRAARIVEYHNKFMNVLNKSAFEV